MSAIDAKFGHVNVTARDWRRLAAFYTDVFGCAFVAPERDIRSADLDAATGLHDEIAPHPGARVDRPGWGHVAFQVPDVPAAVDAVVAAGGAPFGEVVAMQTKDGRTVTWGYTTDPDGNLVELQAWS